MVSLRAGRIEAQPDDEQHSVGKIALLSHSGVIVASVLLGVRPERLSQQMQDATGRKGPQHPPELALSFSLGHW